MIALNATNGRKVGEVELMHNVPVQSLIDHIKTAVDVDPWAKEMVETMLKEQETKTGHWNGPECSHCHAILEKRCRFEYCPHCGAKMEMD